MRIRSFLPALMLALLTAGHAMAAGRNVIIFVADGLRYDSVTPQTAPALWSVKRDGVDFTNSHSLYPTITTVNASAIATGHYIGDTGNFGNQLLVNFTSAVSHSRTPFLENDAILGEMNAHYGGNYLNEESLLAAARGAGLATASIGKTGPTAIQDVTARDGESTIVIDDAVGTPAGLPVAPDVAAAIAAAGLPATAPRTDAPDNAQQDYLIAIATKVVLPRFARSGKNFAMLFWSRDPDVSQHGETDSPDALQPGINGPTGKAGIADADRSLAALLAALKSLGLDTTTDVFVTADHGFSTIWRKTQSGQDLPPGFVAVDVAKGLGLPLYDVSSLQAVDYQSGERPKGGNGYIGGDPNNPEVVVVSNGGSDFIYLPGADARNLAAKLTGILAGEDYVSGIFVNDALGDIPGTLPMSAINLRGTALTEPPSIIVNFRSFAIPGCKPVLMCVAEVADTSLRSGQGMHGSFSRGDTRNFMAAIGPDFRAHYADRAPIANSDIAPTLARILGLTIQPKGGLTGRVIGEALRNGKPVAARRGRLVSPPGASGLRTVLDFQQVGTTRYFDAAGYPGRTVGLSSR